MRKYPDTWAPRHLTPVGDLGVSGYFSSQNGTLDQYDRIHSDNYTNICTKVHTYPDTIRIQIYPDSIRMACTLNARPIRSLPPPPARLRPRLSPRKRGISCRLLRRCPVGGPPRDLGPHDAEPDALRLQQLVHAAPARPPKALGVLAVVARESPEHLVLELLCTRRGAARQSVRDSRASRDRGPRAGAPSHRPPEAREGRRARTPWTGPRSAAPGS